MQYKQASALLAIAFLSACSVTLPVRGQLQATDETFTGTATGQLDGGGSLEIVSSKGAVCKGSFVYVSARQGEGVFNCNDKRSGPFQFSSTGTRGAGWGTLNGDRFTFTFGS